LEVVKQVERVRLDASHLIVSSGGNDALHASMLLEQSGRLLEMLADARKEFRLNHRRLLQALKKTAKPTVICTIYDSILHLGREKKAALSIFNDIIISEASQVEFPVIDLRPLCNEESDYSALSPIEPSFKRRNEDRYANSGGRPEVRLWVSENGPVLMLYSKHAVKV
jgi:hypothetical protein